MIQRVVIAFALLLGACGGTWAPSRQISEKKPQFMITTRPSVLYFGASATNRCGSLSPRREYLTCTSAVPPGAKPGTLPEDALVEVLEYPVSWQTSELTEACRNMALVRVPNGQGLVSYADLAKPDPKKRHGAMFVANPDGVKANDVATGENTSLAYGERVERLSCGDQLLVDSRDRTLHVPQALLTEASPDPAYPGWQTTCGSVEKRVASAPSLPTAAALAIHPPAPTTMFRLTFEDRDVALVEHTPGDYAYTLQTTGGTLLIHTKLPMRSSGYAGGSTRDLLVRATGNVRDLKVMKAVEINAVACAFPCFYDPAVFGAPDLKSHEGQ